MGFGFGIAARQEKIPPAGCHQRRHPDLATFAEMGNWQWHQCEGVIPSLDGK